MFGFGTRELIMILIVVVIVVVVVGVLMANMNRPKK
jgi:hypothetical protein